MIYKVKRVYYITILCHLVYSVKVLTTYRVFFRLIRPKNDEVPHPKEILTLRTFLKGFTCNLTLF